MPSSVIVAPAPKRFRKAATQKSLQIGGTSVDRTNRDGRHLILADHQDDHCLWLRHHEPGAPLAILIPLDEDFPLRVASAVRFQRRLTSRSAGPLPRALQLTERHRIRLVHMLRAFDLHRANVTYRTIATALFGADAAAERGWKTLPVRAQTIRLVKDANAMVHGSYLDLLRGR
jgi:hypothetical protein